MDKSRSIGDFVNPDQVVDRGTTATGSENSATGNAYSEQPCVYTAEEYLCSSRRYTQAKRKFRHSMHRAVQQCKGVWGNRTLKELTPGELAHIHKEIVSRCPVLAGRELDVEKILRQSLIQAKFEEKKKKKTISALADTDDATVAKATKKGVQKGKSKAGPSNDARKTRETQAATKADKTSKRPQEKKRKGKKKSRLDLLTSSEEDDTSTSEEEAEERTTTVTAPPKLAQFSPGCEVIILNQGCDIAQGLFLYNKNDMYANVQFKKLLSTHYCEVELPQPLKTKVIMGDLEEDDIFMWKLEKMKTKKRRHVPNRKYQ